MELDTLKFKTWQYQSKPVNVTEKKSSKVLDKRKQVISGSEGSFDERMKSFR